MTLDPSSPSGDPTFSSPDPNVQGLAIFGMPTLTWPDQYTAGAPPHYEESDLMKGVYSDPQK